MKNEDVVKVGRVSNRVFYRQSSRFLSDVLAEVFKRDMSNAECHEAVCIDDDVRALMDVGNLTWTRARVLGFLQVMPVRRPELWLVPAWYLPFMKDGMRVFDVNGEESVYHSGRRYDVFMNCMNFGIEIPER